MEEPKTKPHANNLCGAKTRVGAPCKNKAMPNGRCRMHGGKSTGPKDKASISECMKGNKKAVTTGENESIIFDFLDEEEKGLLEQINLDKLIQIDNDIKLIDIRLRRMMGRIAKLQQGEMSTIEISLKSGPMGDEMTEKKRGTLGQIQNIEEAITRVQAQKLKLIESKHKLEIDLKVNISTEDKIEELLDLVGGKIDEY